MQDTFEQLRDAMGDRYTLERELGAGGMATVYLAHDLRHNRKVAIKVMHPELAALIGADRFLKEIETTANLQHPHILSLFDSGRVERTVFFVMPYVQGESLRARLKREIQLPIADAVRITGEIASALDYAHRQGVIHRDIKPDNVLFHDGRALVADFGIALARSQAQANVRITRSGVSLGTPEYMSPEQASGSQGLDARTDVYALGVVLYEMLTGRPPFTGLTAQEIFTRVMSDEAKPIRDVRKTVPPHVDEAVLRAIDKLPADRWQTAAQFADAIVREKSGDWLTGNWRPIKRRWRASVPWALVGLLAVAAGWMSLPRRGSTDSLTPVRFGVELDPGVEPTFTPIVRLSADASELVFSAMVDRREEVVRRPLDRMRMSVIAGAGQGDQGTGNSRPFLSPDGRWVAYARQGKLWKVPVEGGPPVDLARADWAGGNWGRNGKLVYTRAYNTGLWMVSEGGGDERMISAPDTTKGELGHWWPQLLPDGDHVMFTAYRTPTERSTIEVLSIKSGERRVVLTGGVFGFYVPTGHLLYAAGETIRAAPFNLKRLEVTGPAIPVVDSVAMNPTDGAAAFDVSETGTLAYLPVSSYVTDVNVVLVDRQGHERLALPTADRYNHPRLSPDGTRISVDIRSANSMGDVWMFQIGRPGGTRITAAGGRDFGAEWTPDGRELIYSSEDPFFDLSRRAADASRPGELLLQERFDHYTGSVSPDGRVFVYVLAVQSDRGAELWTVTLHGPPKTSRYFANGFNLAHPSLSPDGRWMAYDSDESGRVEVYVQSYPDAQRKRWKVSPAQGSEPLWTRGGRELVYRKGDSVMAVTVDLENGRTGPPTLLFSGPYPDSPGWTRPRSYDVSRDGERFLLTKVPPRNARPHIAVVLNWFAELRAKVP
jgi:Tol biopolymer transport system component/tRNA A-37 threonylcarbamoyl transferase component Bud32